MRRLLLLSLTLITVLAITSPAVSTPISAAKKCVKSKKKCPKKTAAATLKDGTYTFKNDRGKVNTLKVSGGGKKVTISFVHFGGGAPGAFPWVQGHTTWRCLEPGIPRTCGRSEDG